MKRLLLSWCLATLAAVVLPASAGAFTIAPADPYTGERVTFVAPDHVAGYQYQWQDRTSTGTASWPIGSGSGATVFSDDPEVVQTFSRASDKYVAYRRRRGPSAGWSEWRYLGEGGIPRAITVRQGPRPAASLPDRDGDGDGAPEPPAPTVLSATPATLGSVYSGAAPGSTIDLAAGDYGRRSFAAKAGPARVTLEGDDAATMYLDLANARNVTFDGLRVTGGEITGTPANVTIQNSRFSGTFVARVSTWNQANVLLTDNTHRDISPNGGWEGRVQVATGGVGGSNPSGLTIQRSVFSGGASDGIQVGGRGVRILRNEFANLIQGDADVAHTDPIQGYGNSDTVIEGNYVRDSSMGIVFFDGTSGERIVNNVVEDIDSQSIVVNRNSLVEHNTVVRGGLVRVYANRGTDGTGTTIRNNVFNATSVTTANASAGANVSNAIFLGGVSPTTFAGFRLAPGSPGKGAATDGLDVGITG